MLLSFTEIWHLPMRFNPLIFENRRFSRFVVQTLLINLSAALVVTFLTWMTGGIERALAGENLLGAIIYSNCIGTICSLIIAYGVAHFKHESVFVRLLQIIISIFLGTLFGVTLGNLLMSFAGYAAIRQIFPPNAQTFTFSLIIALIFGIGTGLYEISKVTMLAAELKLRRAEAEEANALTLATEAQLASLESRIHPHFLFNTLNSIAALIREDALLAEQTVEKLAALLRYSLDSNAKNLIALGQELEITEKYLEIEKVRFGKRLNYQINVDNGFYSTQLPPLALQTLVENSIKHVAAKHTAPTEIIVSARRGIDGESVVEVADNGAGFTENDLLENHGIDSLRKRLHANFGNAAQLEIVKNDGAVVQLILPTTKN